MNLFNSKQEAENFKQQLIHYFTLKKDQDVINLLKHATLECTWYTHDNWDGGFDIYELHAQVPINIYVTLENKLNELAEKIKTSANRLIQGNDRIRSTHIVIQQGTISHPPDQDLLMLTEKVKTLLIARATGQNPDENEYKNYRKELLSKQNLKSLMPLFVKHYSNLSEFWIYIKPKYATYAARREHIIEEFKPLINFIENLNKNPIHSSTKITLAKLNSDSVHRLWEKGIERLNSNDLDGAITIARTLIEDVIKQILNDLSVEYDDRNDDLPKLYRRLATKLNLAPDQHIETTFKQILQGCASVVQGLGSLRSKMGDAHAQGKKPVKPAARHAELAVNLAGSMATFLIATWEKNSLKE